MKRVFISILLAVSFLSAESFVGKYEQKHSNSEAYLTIKKLSNNKYQIDGEALYGTKSTFPNIGTVNGIAYAKGNTAVLKTQGYTLTLVLKENKIEATEKGTNNYAGMYVSFSGRYNKVAE